MARLVGLVFAGLVLAVATAAPASAHHADVSATVSCTGVVSFVATAWTGGSAAGRTDAQIRMSYSTDGAHFLPLPGKPGYAFGPGNGFRFTDHFQLPLPLPTAVVVAAQAVVPWADSGPAGGSHTTSRLALPACPPAPATPATSPPSSASPSSPSPTAAPVARPAGRGASGLNSALMAAVLTGCAGVLAVGGWALYRARRG